MNVQSRHSATIERMRIARNVPTAENRQTWSPSPVPATAPDPIRIHPRLRRIAPQIATMLRLDEPTEIEAALYCSCDADITSVFAVAHAGGRNKTPRLHVAVPAYAIRNAVVADPSAQTGPRASSDSGWPQFGANTEDGSRRVDSMPSAVAVNADPIGILWR
jgi:hypothetical protein